jgi:hypothetical protein
MQAAALHAEIVCRQLAIYGMQFSSHLLVLTFAHVSLLSYYKRFKDFAGNIQSMFWKREQSAEIFKEIVFWPCA